MQHLKSSSGCLHSLPTGFFINAFDCMASDPQQIKKLLNNNNWDNTVVNKPDILGKIIEKAVFQHPLGPK